MKKRVNNAQKIRKHPLPALFVPLGIYQNINIETDSADICEFCSVCNAHVDIFCFSAQKQVYRRFRFARKIHHSGKIVSCSERKNSEFNIRVLTYDGGNFVHCSVAACRNNELFSVFYRFLCNFDRMSLVFRFLTMYSMPRSRSMVSHSENKALHLPLPATGLTIKTFCPLYFLRNNSKNPAMNFVYSQKTAQNSLGIASPHPQTQSADMNTRLYNNASCCHLSISVAKFRPSPHV